MALLDGFSLTNIESDGMFYTLTFSRDVTPEQLGKTKPKVNISSTGHGDEHDTEQHISQIMSGVQQGLVLAQSHITGYPVKGPSETIHMHLLIADNEWVRKLHIEDSHSFEINTEPIK